PPAPPAARPISASGAARRPLGRALRAGPVARRPLGRALRAGPVARCPLARTLAASGSACRPLGGALRTGPATRRPLARVLRTGRSATVRPLGPLAAPTCRATTLVVLVTRAAPPAPRAHACPSRVPGSSRAPRPQSAAGIARFPGGTTSPRVTAPVPAPTTTASLRTSTSPGPRCVSSVGRTEPRPRRAPSGRVVHAPGAGVQPRTSRSTTYAGRVQ